MVYTLFQVHTLKFNRKDYDTLSLFYLNRGYYNELSFPCPGTLSRNSECQAERQLYDRVLSLTLFLGAPIVRSLSEKHHKEIWVQFGTLHVLLLHVDELSIFLHTKQVYLAKRKSTQSG
nr:CIC_HP1_G0036480.mRNA.1.CDS.1 [Saccharomyces cerevisiae]